MLDAMIAALPAPAVTGQDPAQHPVAAGAQAGAPRFAATLAATLAAQADADAAALTSTPAEETQAPSPRVTGSAPIPSPAGPQVAIAEPVPGAASLSLGSGMPETLSPDEAALAPTPEAAVAHVAPPDTAHGTDADDTGAGMSGVRERSRLRDAALTPLCDGITPPPPVATLIAVPTPISAELPDGAETAIGTSAIAASAAGPSPRLGATAFRTEQRATPAQAAPENPAIPAPTLATPSDRIAAAVPDPQRPPPAADAPPAETTPTQTRPALPDEARHPAPPAVPPPTAGAPPLRAGDPVAADAADGPATPAEGQPRSAAPAVAAVHMPTPAASADRPAPALPADHARPAPPPASLRDLPVLGFVSDPTRQGFDLRLDTSVLGAIEVEVRQADGAAEVVVRSDRADTLAALARDGGELDRALRDAGIGPEGRSMSFLLAAGGEGQAERRQRGPGSRLSPAEPPQAPASVPPRGAPVSLLDIHV